MRSRILARWTLSVVLALIVLAASLLALKQTPISQSRPLATDYTVGGPCGATIQACIDNPIVQAGDRILILAGTYTESLTLNKPVSLIGAEAETTIIHAVSNQRVITVTGNIITATTVISGLTFTGGQLAGNDYGGGILLINGSTPLIHTVIITNNSTAYYGGGGIFAESSLTLVNAQVLSNTAPTGGGVFAYGPATLLGGRFEGNRSEESFAVGGYGGGVYASNALTLSGTEFIDNTTDVRGGGVYVGGLATISGGRFSDNHAAAGGGIYAGELILTTTEFMSNTASGLGGGGVCVGFVTGPAASRASLVNARFENNQAGSGGGLYIGQSMGTVLTLSDTQFISNAAESNGGGVYASGEVSVIGGRFEGNTAGGNGAGLYAVELNLTGTVIVRNTAVGSGGGILCCGWSRGGRIVNALLTSNTAGSGGAGLHAGEVGTYLAVLHTTIANINMNPRSGIEVYAYYPDAVAITDTIITSHTVGIKAGGGGTVREDYNLFFGNISARSGAIITGTHDVRGNPRFINPAADDYHLAPGSAAVDQGIYVGVKTDLDGNNRLRDYGGLRPDIGAYEYHFQGVIYDTFLPLTRK